MLSRFELNVQTNERDEIYQKVFTDSEGDILVLDVGVDPPDGFAEFTGDLQDLDSPN